MQKSLLIGCGRDRRKQVHQEGNEQWKGPLIRIDMNPDVEPDHVIDMDDIALFDKRLPFEDKTFDEIGAYNCMEHWGRQGYWRGWFREMGEYHRILKPGGQMSILVPIGPDALADPGHTRFFQQNYFNFLSQAFYELNTTQATCFTDYRFVWKKDFTIVYMKEHEGHHLAVILEKP